MDEIPVVKVLIENSEGEFLAVREKESGHWELPGGKIEEDEDRFSAAKREVKEETGLEIEDPNDVIRLDLHREEELRCWMVQAVKRDVEPKPGGKEVDNLRWVTSEEFQELEWSIDAGFNIPVMKMMEEKS